METPRQNNSLPLFINRNKYFSQGFTLVEILVVSTLSLILLGGLFYFFRSNLKANLQQGEISEMRWNGHFILKEIRFHITHAGVGLPDTFNTIKLSSNDLVLKSNLSKRGSSSTLDSTSTAVTSIFKLQNLSDSSLFSNKAWIYISGDTVEYSISAMNLAQGKISISRNKSNYPDFNYMIYPVTLTRLQKTNDMEFKVFTEKLSSHTWVVADTALLADGLDTLRYEFHCLGATVKSSLPLLIDSLLKIDVILWVKSGIKDETLSGDGFRREKFSTLVPFQKTL